MNPSFKYVEVHYALGEFNSKWKRLLEKDAEKYLKPQIATHNCFATIQKFKNPTEQDGELQWVPLYFDFDSEGNLQDAINDSLKIIEYFTGLGIRKEHIRIWFSGKRGFHLIIEPELFGIEPHPELSYQIKLACQFVAHFLKLKTFDGQVYSIKRMWRLPNSIHQVTRLFCIELDHSELAKGPEYIKNKAKKPCEPIYDKIEYENIKEEPGLVSWWQDFLRQYENIKDLQRNCPHKPITKTAQDPMCVKDILDNFIRKPGTRNQACVVLAGYYKDVGSTKEEAFDKINKWGEAIPRELAKTKGRPLQAEIRNVLNTIYGDEKYHFTCSYIRALGTGTDKPIACNYDYCKTANDKQRSGFSFRLTDLGNAERLIAAHRENIRYCHPWHKWLVWDGRRWRIDDTAAIKRYGKETVRSIYVEAAEIEDKRTRSLVAKHATRSESENHINAMINLANSEEFVPILPNQLDTDPWLFNCESGILNLRTGKLQKHNRENLITNLAPVNFNPEAKCPKWLIFFDKIMAGNKGLIGLLQRIAGYCLTGRVSEQKLFFAYGPTMTGKSTFLKTLQGILGEYAIKTTSELLVTKPKGAHTTDITDLKGKRLAITIEIQEGRRMAESLTKELTGGDKIRARRMRQDNEEWEPTHKIILAANHKPIVHETTAAYWRRMCLIPFNIPIPESERINDFYEILLEERDGILNWLLQGCLDWQKQGLAEPPEVIEATKAYRSEMDILGEFIEDCCIIGQGLTVSNKEIRSDYLKWCDQAGEKPVSPKTFALRFEEKGLIRARTANQRIWKGIGLQDIFSSKKEYGEEEQ